MKTFRALLMCLLLTCCYACHNKPYPYTMQMADTLVYSNPDSAIILLAQLKDSINTEPKSTQMYCRLLTLKAKDKSYISYSLDSLILQILYYYEEKNDKEHLPEAYYYAGRAYSNLGDTPEALVYYLKAVELLEESTNYRLLKAIYSQMGDLFLFQDSYEEAIKAFKKAYYYNTLLKDNRGKIINLCSLGTVFTACGNTDSSLYYYQKAYEQAEISGNAEYTDNVKQLLVSLYIQLKQFDLAKATLQSIINPSAQNQTAIYSIAANLYHKTEQIDSAKFYYHKLLKQDDVYAQQIAHWGLTEIALKQSNSENALEHLRQYNEWTDSIRKITDNESIRKMQMLYNYQLKEKENIVLRANKAQQKKQFVYSFLILSLFAISFIAYMQNNRRRKLQLKTQLDKLEQLREEQYQRSNLFIEENKYKIEELEKELLLSNENNKAMKKNLLAQKEQILRMNSKIEADQEEQSLAEIAFHQSDIYSKFHDAANGKGTLNTKDWELLHFKVDSCYKDFTSRLRAIYPVSDMEMKVCLLLKINISVTGISLLVGRTKPAIVSIRKKLYEKTYGEAGKAEQWDEFILSL